jgi:serine/threonine protein kinase
VGGHEPQMQLAQDTVIAGRFRLNHLIARGGMGSVWHATHLGLDIPCAVKFIETALSNTAQAQARFEREAKAAAQLRSPHVVQVLDHGVCDGTPYIAMELLEGEDLRHRLAVVGQLRAPDLFHILNQVCRALTKAHGLGIVHRDLKPDNIFLVRDDDREIAKVLDFGIAKLQRTELSTGSSTAGGAMLGTPYYMSPEQAQGTKSVDARSDLWSLAVIAYQALTGVPPFESDGLGDLLIKIMVTELPVPSQHGPTPPGFDAWWRKAASRDPAGRFQTAKEFAESLGVVCQVTAGVGLIDSVDPGIRPPPSTLDLTVNVEDVQTALPYLQTQASQPGLLQPAGQPAVGAPAVTAAPMSAAMTPSPLSYTFAREPSGRRKVFVVAAVCGVVVGCAGLFLALRGTAGHPESTAVREAASASSAASSPPPVDSSPVPTPPSTAPTLPAPPPTAETSPAAAPPAPAPPTAKPGPRSQPRAVVAPKAKPTPAPSADMGF